MGILHYQVIFSGYHNDVQHWKYPPRIGKFEMADYTFHKDTRVEFYPSAIVIDDDDWCYGDDYGSHPLVVALDEQDEENQSYIVDGWYWRWVPDDPVFDTIEYATKGFWESPYFSQE